MNDLTEGQKTSLWVFGALNDLVSAGLVDGPKLLTPKGCSAYDQIDAARNKLDPEKVASRLAYHLIQQCGHDSDHAELAAIHEIVDSYLKMDRDLFHATYKPDKDPPP
jgi:hypothetical protein